MKKILMLCLLFLIFGCFGKIDNRFMEIKNEISFVNTISNSDKIIIKRFKKNCLDTLSGKDCFEESSKLETKSKLKIQIFEKLFDNKQITGYCCCPKINYAIDFYSNHQNFETYFVAATTIRDSVRVFESSYQFSYIIEKQKWDAFLLHIKD